jgi:UDP-N-acetylmuramyl pentapeptide phosphotransferase/UDP-N-acetylglucosamine-1-phosphate transferase
MPLITINSIIVFIIASAVTSICVPLVIKLAIKKRLLGEFGEGRHVHKGYVPRLGGVAIYIGFLFSQLYFFISDSSSIENPKNYLLLLFGVLLLFVLGILDDLVDLKAHLKFYVQLLVAVILVWNADIRVESFHGVLGLETLPTWFSYLFSILVITFFINAYNLIDGIDTLSSSIGMFVLVCFGLVFLYNGAYLETVLAFSVFGALFGFWFYNKPPAKIFMGDSGTLSMGLLMAYFAIRVTDLPLDAEGTISPVFAFVVLSYPAIDTLRVFTVRILNGRSPFSPDRNHIHHLLLDMGYSHGKATRIIILITLLLSVAAYLLRTMPTTSFCVMIASTVILANVPFLILKYRNK